MVLDRLLSALARLLPTYQPPAQVDQASWDTFVELADAGLDEHDIAAVLPTLTRDQLQECLREYQRLAAWNHLPLDVHYPL